MQMPVTVQRRQQAYLEFSQGLKIYNAREGQPAIQTAYEKDLEPQFEAEHGRKPADWREVAPLVEPLPAWQFDRAINRQSQEMMWDGILDIVDSAKGDMRQTLDDPAMRKLGSVTLNPNLELPRYYSEVEFHLRPGGMWKGEYQGWYTTIANWVYFMGNNNALSDQTAAVENVPATKADGSPFRKAIDLACGTGQSTFPLKKRFAEAEVHGVDMSAGLVDYAHVAANAQGLDIHFSQQNAERTNFPDGSFDLVHAFILFHEIPDKAARNVIAEAYRLLSPGGIFSIADIPPYRTMPLYRQFFTDWQTEHNGEVFWRTHGQRDLVQWMKDAGFREAKFGPIPGKTIGQWIGTK